MILSRPSNDSALWANDELNSKTAFPQSTSLFDSVPRGENPVKPAEETGATIDFIGQKLENMNKPNSKVPPPRRPNGRRPPPPRRVP